MKVQHLQNKIHIAIIGGQGLIGKHVVYRLANQPNVRIWAADLDFFSQHKDLSKFKATIEQPIINFTDISNAGTFIEARQFDYIIYCAGYESPTDGLHPSYVEEVKSLQALANVLNSLPLSRYIGDEKDMPYFMYISSWNVYGKCQELPIEDNMLVPANYSGMLKMAAEDLVQRICTKYNIKYSILRPTEVYGKWNFTQIKDEKYWKGYLNYFINGIVKKNKSLQVVSPTTKIDLVSANYVAKVIVYMLANQLTGIYNISSGESLSLEELALRVLKTYGSSETVLELTNSLQIEDITVDSSKIRALVEYDKNKYNLDKFIAEYLPVRRLEIAKSMAIEQIMSEKTLFDTTAFGAKEAYLERVKNRKIAYHRIKKIAGDQFKKIKYARFVDRAQEVLEGTYPKPILTDITKNKEYLLEHMKEIDALDVDKYLETLENKEVLKIDNISTKKVDSNRKKRIKKQKKIKLVE